MNTHPKELLKTDSVMVDALSLMAVFCTVNGVWTGLLSFLIHKYQRQLNWCHRCNEICIVSALFGVGTVVDNAFTFRGIVYLFTPSVLWCCWLGDRKGIGPVQSTAIIVFLAHRDSVVASCCLQNWNTVIVTGGKLHWSQRVRLPAQPSQCSSPILAALWWLLSKSGTLPSFSASMLFVGQQEGIQCVKVLPHQFPKVKLGPG